MFLWGHIRTRSRSGADINDPDTALPEEGESRDCYLDLETCRDLSPVGQELTAPVLTAISQAPMMDRSTVRSRFGESIGHGGREGHSPASHHEHAQ